MINFVYFLLLIQTPLSLFFLLPSWSSGYSRRLVTSPRMEVPEMVYSCFEGAMSLTGEFLESEREHRGSEHECQRRQLIGNSQGMFPRNLFATL